VGWGERGGTGEEKQGGTDKNSGWNKTCTVGDGLKQDQEGFEGLGGKKETSNPHIGGEIQKEKESGV